MTDFQKFVLAFFVVVGLFLAAGFSFKIGQKRGYRSGYDAALNEPHKADTVWKTDTFLVDNPVEKIRWKDRLVYVPVTDSVIVHHHDTTYVALEFEKVEYSDSTYRAEVSGFQPKLDWIEVYPKTAYITNTVVKTRKWGFGVTAGPGLIWNGSFYGGVGLVAGLSYTF